ncbi:hypothetical protein PoB_004309800 [Plakobranchus ocellatus]|uniref:Uncharacterized protein n=1 Tax=Plakobranchus ocellatus TaxID=259542 RepID=A0AAV4BBR8_9GAST|nr:hypothetical protein PoB_004309800 [Plakobranchus ocellatus]
MTRFRSYTAERHPATALATWLNYMFEFSFEDYLCSTVHTSVGNAGGRTKFSPSMDLECAGKESKTRKISRCTKIETDEAPANPRDFSHRSPPVTNCICISYLWINCVKVVINMALTCI